MIEKEIGPYLDELTTQDNFSGVVLIAKDEVSVFKQAYGLAHQGYQIPNQIGTKYNIGSVTKMFTALAIAQLAAQGKLDFNDPLGEHISGFPQEVSEKVRLYHLLTHTSGMAGSILNDQTFPANKDRVRTTADWMAFVVDVPLLFEPGTSWSYSNAGFVTLGAVIEAVTGNSYFDYVKEYIWQPAKMYDTGSSPLDEDVPNRALGYMNREEDEPANLPRKNNVPYSLIRGSAHGGAWSTAEDLLHFAIALQDFSLLDSNFTETLLTTKVLTGRRPDEEYAYGFFSEMVNGHRIVGHPGSVAGFNAWFDIYRDLDHMVIILSNYAPPSAQQVGEHIRSLIA